MEDDRRELVYYPRAQRDLEALEKRFARRILDALLILGSPPWPPGKVKKLHGCDFWELKCGDFRAMFLPRGKKVILVRVVNRRDLGKALGGIDRRAVDRWLKERGEQEPPGERVRAEDAMRAAVVSAQKSFDEMYKA